MQTKTPNPTLQTPKRPALPLELWYRIVSYAIKPEAAVIPSVILRAEYTRQLRHFKELPTLLAEAERLFWRDNEVSVVTGFGESRFNSSELSSYRTKIQRLQLAIDGYSPRLAAVGWSILMATKRAYAHLKTLTVQVRMERGLHKSIFLDSRFVEMIRKIELPEVIIVKTKDPAKLQTTKFQVCRENLDTKLNTEETPSLGSGSRTLDIIDYFDEMPNGYGFHVPGASGGKILASHGGAGLRRSA